MVDSLRRCPDNRDAVEILAFLEGDLSGEDRASLEAHLPGCEVCSEELRRLRRMSAFLRDNPECFHPDAAEFYAYIRGGEDGSDQLAAHLRECPACRDAADAMREMLAVGRGKDLSPLRMPAELMSRLNDLFSGQSEDRSPAKPLSWLSEWLNKYTSVPVLALGTAAALLIAAVLIVPVWRSLKEPSQLDFGPSQEIPRPVSQSRDGMPKAAAPPAVPGEKPTEAPEPRNLEESKAARRLPSVSAHEKERDERAEAKTYAAKPGPLREEDEETGRIGISSRRDLAPKAPAAGLRMKRPTVLLSIDGPEGRPLPGLASAIPEALRQRFDFVNEAVEKPRVEKRKDTASSEKMAERDLRKLPDQTIRITVKVTRTEHGFTVTAKLFEKGSVDETKSITDIDVSIEKLPEEVGRIVGDLLASR